MKLLVLEKLYINEWNYFEREQFMAVQAVSGVSEIPVTGNMPSAEGGQKDYTKMTPK